MGYPHFKLLEESHTITLSKSMNTNLFKVWAFFTKEIVIFLDYVIWTVNLLMIRILIPKKGVWANNLFMIKVVHESHMLLQTSQESREIKSE